MSRDRSVQLIAKSYAWVIAVLGLLSVVNAVAVHSTLKMQLSHSDLAMTSNQQVQAFIAVQTVIAAVIDTAKNEALPDTRFERVKHRLIEVAANLEQVNADVVAAFAATEGNIVTTVPEATRSAYFSKPFELARWMEHTSGRARAIASLTREEIVSYNNWSPTEVALASGTTLKGFRQAEQALKEDAKLWGARAERFHQALTLLALLTLAIEAALIFGPLIRKVRQEAERLEAAHAEIEVLAFSDGLTGAANRVRFRRALSIACEAASKGAPFAVILSDLNRFKSVNDGFGHQAGDQLLVEVTNRLRASIRPGDIVARIGGDEFAILAPGLDTEEGVQELALAITAEVARPWHYDGFDFDVSISVGAALCPRDSDDPDRLLAYADRALYESKQEGLPVSVFKFEDRALRDGDSALLRGLPIAIARGEFELHYQPKVRISDGAMIGAEALVRWRHPQHGLLSPASFLPIVLRGGRMVELTHTILHLAGSNMACWRREGIDFGRIAVNIPESMLTGRLGFDCLTEVLDCYSLDGDLFTFEITEDVLFSRAAATIQAEVENISAAGVRISFDDFGTGFASLSHLRHFRFDELKIDRSFVSEIGRSEMSEKIVLALVSLAQALGKEIVAEGVETEDQLAFLREAGCTYAQGYLYARPMPAADFEAWTRTYTSSFQTGRTKPERNTALRRALG
ncbi:putative bifunctional diguanylate cyclase/phosphodiesterase [Chthonobacter albigriseus]|uniref:putative bifunctional diguanylate cyclase/phosphodiesterase n=1 Tax=Chthonobacter albigriseus TaxID=1683161 RepID=UPI0015EE8CD3|nr:bifunctional diguanylate cyclase/phosphodiesterase [Chthonobacter albigriseus]